MNSVIYYLSSLYRLIKNQYKYHDNNINDQVNFSNAYPKIGINRL